LLIGDPVHFGFPYPHPQSAHRNRATGSLPTQGSYFRSREGAGFVVVRIDLLREWKLIQRRGLEPGRRLQRPRAVTRNCSTIDCRLHDAAFAWHRIISLRSATAPRCPTFLVRKGFCDLGIDETDDPRAANCPELSPPEWCTTTDRP
jgi:hypothetical protein